MAAGCEKRFPLACRLTVTGGNGLAVCCGRFENCCVGGDQKEARFQSKEVGKMANWLRV